MKKSMFDKAKQEETGAALVIALIVLFVGALLIPPLLNLSTTGVMTERVFENKTRHLYAAEAGVENSIYMIMNGDAALTDLDEEEAYSYSLPDPLDNSTVNVTVTKYSLIEGLLGDKEYRLNQPHEQWAQLSESGTRNQTEDWVEYTCDANFSYDGVPWRTMNTVGACFFPPPGDTSMIDGPVLASPGTPGGEITFNKLESVETKMTAGAFAFIWRWENNKGPKFRWPAQTDGSISFKFKVDDPDWEYDDAFVWATFKEQDISYSASSGFSKWLIESTAGDTTIRAAVYGGSGTPTVLTWEINPPG